MTSDQAGGAGAAAVRETVERIWRAVLTVPGGREEATFFELNGESIAAVRIVSRIEAELGVEVDIGDLFEEDPNLEALCRTVEELAGQRLTA